MRSALYEQFPMMARPCPCVKLFGRVGSTYLRAAAKRGEAGPAQRTPRPRHREQPPADPPLRRRHRGHVELAGGLAAALQAVRGDATWVGWPAPSCRRSSSGASNSGSRKDHLRPSSSAPTRRRTSTTGLQRHALAALPLLLGSPPDHSRGVEAVRRGERAFRRHDRRARRARRAGLDPRLPPDARAGVPAPPGPATLDRVLPAHAVPVERGLSAAPGARAAPARRPRCGLRQLPDRRLRAALSLVVSADPRDRLGAGLARDRRPPGRDRRRPDRDRHRRLPRGHRRSRDGPAPRRARAAVRGPKARTRGGAARLHEGHSAEAPKRSSASSSRIRAGLVRRR